MEKITAKQAVEQIKELLFGKTPTPKVPASTATSTDYPVKDGSTLSATPEMAKGNPVHLKTTDGTTPAPDGEYELSSGHVISVVGGKCMDMSDPQTEETAMKEEFAAIKLAFATQTEAVEKLTAEFEAEKTAKAILEAEKVTAEAEKKELVAKFDAQTVQLAKVLEIVEAMAAEPAAEPAQSTMTMMGAVAKAEKDAKKDLMLGAMTDFFAKNTDKKTLKVN